MKVCHEYQPNPKPIYETSPPRSAAPMAGSNGKTPTLLAWHYCRAPASGNLKWRECDYRRRLCPAVAIDAGGRLAVQFVDLGNACAARKNWGRYDTSRPRLSAYSSG